MSEKEQENRAPSAAGSTQVVEGARQSEGTIELDLDPLARVEGKFNADLWRNQALSNSSLIASHKIFLVALAQRFDEAGFCFATATELGEATSSSPNTITRCGKFLEEKGWFTRKRRRNGTEYYALRGRDSP